MTRIPVLFWAVFSLLFSSSSARTNLNVQTCSPGQPSACAFQYQSEDVPGYPTEHYSWCTWEPEGGFSHFYLMGNNSHRFVGLTKLDFSGRLTSKRACSTRRSTKCLSFQYFFEENDSVTLSVYVVNAQTKTEIKLWHASSSNSGSWVRMNQARVPISTDFDYAVVFEVKRLRRRASGRYQNTVYIDNIEFTDRSCDLHQSNAIVETPALSTTANTILVTFPSTTGKQQKSVEESEGFHSTFSTESKHFSAENATAPKLGIDSNGVSVKLEAQKKNALPDDPKDKRYAITGVVISCVVVVAVIGIVMGALYKRNMLPFCKRGEPLRKNNVIKCPETLQSSNSQNVGTHRHMSHLCTISQQVQEQRSTYLDFSDSHKLVPNPQTGFNVDSENLTNVRSDKTYCSQEPPTQELYAVVNKGRNECRLIENDPENFYHVPEEDDRVYQNVNETRNASVMQKTPVQHDESSYNVLEFDTTRKGVQKHSGGSMKVAAIYSHLNTQEDAYNEIERDRRIHIIDAEYSHIH